MSDREIRRLARIVADQGKQIRQISAGKPQLAYSTIENGAIKERDADGELTMLIGRQEDGTHTTKHVDGPIPHVLSVPVVEVDGPVVSVTWDGQTATGEPLYEDFRCADVEVITPLDTGRVVGNLTTREGSAVVFKARNSGLHVVTLVARSMSGKTAPASEPVLVSVSVPTLTGAIQAVQQSANGKNSVIYDSVPPSPSDPGQEGDTWWVNEPRLRDPDDPGSEQYVAIIEQWQHRAGAWVQVEVAHEVIASVDLGTATVGYLDGIRIAAQSIDTTQLVATAIDGMVITGAVFQTAHEDPRGMFDAGGIRFTDEEGSTRINLAPEPDGGDVFGLVDEDGRTIFNVSGGGIASARSLESADDLIVLGTPLIGDFEGWESPAAHPMSGWLDRLPRGIISRGRQDGLLSWGVTNGEFSLMEIQADMYPDRMYELVVSPFAVSVEAGRWFHFNVRYEWGVQPTFSSALMHNVSFPSSSGGRGVMLSLNKSYYPSSAANVRMLISVRSNGTVGMESDAVEAYVRDIGPMVENTAIYRPDNSGGTPPPAETKKNYTKTYDAISGRTWANGSYRSDKNGLAYQGAQGGRTWRSMITFPSMTSDLSGAEITSVEAYLYFDHWWYGSGGTARIHLHGQTGLTSSVPSMTSAVSVSGWARGSGRWVSIPSSYWNGFRTGTYRGIGLGTASGSLTEYGYADVGRSKIRIKYKK